MPDYQSFGGNPATVYRKNRNSALASDVKNSIRSVVSGRWKRHRRMSVRHWADINLDAEHVYFRGQSGHWL